jgi:hypothetical protein
MSTRAPASALDFAITATLAVLPVMLGALWLVAVVRPAAEAEAPPSDRHVAARRVAALQTFEPAIVVRTAAPAVAPSPRQVLDGVPACRSAWAGGAAVDLRQSLAGWLGREAAPFVPPAQTIARQLAALDAALLRFSSGDNARVAQPLALDTPRWFAAAQAAVGGTVDGAAGLPLGCDDLAGALSSLLRGQARLLESLEWRGTTGATTLARWPAERQVAFGAAPVLRRNPWAGVAGCVWLGEDALPGHHVAAARSAQRRVCLQPSARVLDGEPALSEAADDGRWSVPPSLSTLLAPLDALRQPSHPLYRRVARATPTDGAPAAAHQRLLDGAPVDVGYAVQLTIDPSLQALAQKTAACYTGRHAVCRALGMQRRDDAARPLGDALLEGAMVRMAAVAVVDVASGRIEALAGALSPCARQEVDGPGRGAGCDRRLPFPVRYRADALLNPALFHDAMPASTVKPILAAAFLADPGVGARWLAAESPPSAASAPPARRSLRSELLRSDSARFLDRMFCLDGDIAGCRRAAAIQAVLPAFGWNAACDGAGTACGKRDLLFGRAPGDEAAADSAGGAHDEAAPAPALAVAYGRLLVEPQRPGGPMRPMRLQRPPDESIVRRCAAGADGRRASDDDWEKCRGGAFVDIVAEGWGQGHARASALGVAGMMARLAAAANGAPAQRAPHLVVRVLRADGTDAATLPGLAAWQPAPALPVDISSDAARVIFDGLAHGHRAGTARSACAQVFDARRCEAMRWLAGKTGTPSFPSDGVSLDELARQCGADRAAAPPRVATGSRPVVCSALRPYKWYVAAYRADGSGDGPWTKVIAVLTERNWLRRNGQVHASGDHGPNPAAEIALQIAGRQVGAVAGSLP